MSDLSTLASLDAIAGLASTLSKFDETAAGAARERQNMLTKPVRSLGRLEDLAVFMAGWRATPKPPIETAQAIVFAGNHGICAHGVSPFPQEVTRQMVANFETGGAAINQLCKVAGAKLSVVELNLDRPTADFTEQPAMTEAECLRAIQTGASAIHANADVLILGEMGIGNSTVAAALAHACFGGAAKDWVGRGTGSDAAGIARKVDVVDRGVKRHGGRSAMQKLAAVGGYEQAAICGAVLAARAARIPVILDGFICTASVAPLYATSPDFLAHCLVGHVSAEPGHRRLLEAMNLKPILNLDMALGEGSGAAVALNILRAALACHNGMATFAEAGVSNA